jgi:hypothetical protein
MSDVLRPIRIFGLLLIVFSILSSFIFIRNYLGRPISNGMIYFLVGVHFFHFLTGIGVIFLTKWGYVLFKLFLYISYPAFPIGTIISYYTLSYMKKNQIKKFFGFS